MPRLNKVQKLEDRIAPSVLGFLGLYRCGNNYDGSVPGYPSGHIDTDAGADASGSAGSSHGAANASANASVDGSVSVGRVANVNVDGYGSASVLANWKLR